MRTAITIITLTVFCVSYSLAQDTHLKPKTCQDYFNRTLVVELLEENPKTLARMRKLLHSDVNRLNVYQNFIAEYNEYIQTAVKKYWKVNKKIEFKRTSEIKKLQAEKNRNFVSLTFHYADRSENGIHEVITKNDDYGEQLRIPTLIYKGTDKHTNDFGVHFFLPFVNQRVMHDPEESILLFSIHFMNEYLETLSNHKGSHYDVKRFVKEEVEKNCFKLSNRKLILNDISIGNYELKEIEKVYPHEHKVGHFYDIAESIKNENVGEAVALIIPRGFLQTGNVRYLEHITCMKLIIASDTGEVLGASGEGTGEGSHKEIKKSDFKHMAKCKEVK